MTLTIEHCRQMNGPPRIEKLATLHVLHTYQLGVVGGYLFVGHVYVGTLTMKIPS